MNLARSTFYDEPVGQALRDAKIVWKIGEICAEYPRYGYRRVTALLRRDGLVVNHKRTMRIMHEQGLSVRPRRRFVTTTDSDHRSPIFPNLTIGLKPAGPNELWVADLTYIAIAKGFVYLAVVLDAWSRRVVGYALGRAVDTRLTLAALRSATADLALDACTIPTVGLSMLPISIGRCLPSMVCAARWVAAAYPMTMPRPKAL
jgi:putative transposase